MAPRFLTAGRAAEVLGLTTQTLRNWRVADEGPPWKRKGLSSDALYDADELLAWAEKHNVAVVRPDLAEEQPKAATAE